MRVFQRARHSFCWWVRNHLVNSWLDNQQSKISCYSISTSWSKVHSFLFIFVMSHSFHKVKWSERWWRAAGRAVPTLRLAQRLGFESELEAVLSSQLPFDRNIKDFLLILNRFSQSSSLSHLSLLCKFRCPSSFGRFWPSSYYLSFSNHSFSDRLLRKSYSLDHHRSNAFDAQVQASGSEFRNKLSSQSCSLNWLQSESILISNVFLLFHFFSFVVDRPRSRPQSSNGTAPSTSCSVISLSNFLKWVEEREIDFSFRCLSTQIWILMFPPLFYLLSSSDLVIPPNLWILRIGNSFGSIPKLDDYRLANWSLLLIRRHVPLLGSQSLTLGTTLQAHSQETSRILSSFRFSSRIRSSSWSFDSRSRNNWWSILIMCFDQEPSYSNCLSLDRLEIIPSYRCSFRLWFPNLYA